MTPPLLFTPIKLAGLTARNRSKNKWLHLRPIGVTPVRLVSIQGNMLIVTGLDAMDGTAVLDVKPYIPEFDRVDDVKMPDWVATMVQGYF